MQNLNQDRQVMDPKRLQQLLGELHRELITATSVDPESRRMLGEVLNDIQQLTEAPARGEAARPGEQLRAIALRLEAEHPRLANAIGQVSDALAKLGI
jgi:flagellar motor switch protein FliG